MTIPKVSLTKPTGTYAVKWIDRDGNALIPPSGASSLNRKRNVLQVRDEAMSMLHMHRMQRHAQALRAVKITITKEYNTPRYEGATYGTPSQGYEFSFDIPDINEQAFDPR